MGALTELYDSAAIIRKVATEKKDTNLLDMLRSTAHKQFSLVFACRAIYSSILIICTWKAHQ